jgi:DNA ligase-1
MFVKKPMLCGEAPTNLSLLSYPIYASPKLDGIRGIAETGVLMSRSGKPIPNRFVQKFFADHKELDGLDGELIVGEPNDKNVYNKTSSGVMSRDGEPDFVFYVFDYVNAQDLPYTERQKIINNIVGRTERLLILPQVEIHSPKELTEYEEKVLNLGYEGLVLRKMVGKYKFGRSTTNEALLLKLKRFTDAEAVIVDYQELLHNDNDAKKDAFGHTERSSHKDNMVPMGTLGSLVVKDFKTNIQFNIGTGFDEVMRAKIWNNRDKYKGSIVKYKHFEVGVKDLPRFPVFVGFRDKIDM